MLEAGTGRVDVSPRKPLFLVGYPHVPRMSTGVHDPLFATALCLRNGAVTTLSVAVDILFVGRALVEACRRRIGERTGIPPQAILISATHTHSGPVTCTILAWRDDPVVPAPDPEYLALLEDGIVGAACRAVDALQPAGLAVTTARIDGVGCNRLDPDGVRDPEAGVLVVRRQADDRLMALQVVYAMHPTVLHEDTVDVSSDFPGYARACVEEAYPGARLLYHTGPCGNLSPRYHVRGQTFAEAQRLGRRLGACVRDAVGRLTNADFSSDLALGAQSGLAALPSRRFPSVAAAEAALQDARATYERLKREGAAHGPVRTAECTVFGAEEVVTMAKAQADGSLAAVVALHGQAEVQVLRFGDAFLACLPGECFVEYALAIKQAAPGRVFVVSLANGESLGYITTPGATGYEANLSVFTPEAGAELVRTARRLLGAA